MQESLKTEWVRAFMYTYKTTVACIVDNVPLYFYKCLDVGRKREKVLHMKIVQH